MFICHMKKVFYLAALSLLLSACGGNPKKSAEAASEPVSEESLAPVTLSAEEFARMQDLYQETDDDHGWKPLCKWQFVDLDGDGIDEVWMRDAGDEYGAFFTFDGENIDLIGVETDRFPAYTREQQDGKGYFCKGGSAGGPSYYTEIVTLKNSRVVDRFNQLEVYGELENATLNGKEVGEEQAGAFMKALPESAELTPGEWNMLDLTDYDRVPSHDNTPEEDRIIQDFITRMYNQSLYVEDEFLEEHCTPRMLQQLKDDYEYDGEGYANWDFRSESNDGFSDGNSVISVEKIDGRYYYEAKDAGYIFRNILSAFVQDGKVMFDGITVDATYPVFDPFADDAEEEFF